MKRRSVDVRSRAPWAPSVRPDSSNVPCRSVSAPTKWRMQPMNCYAWIESVCLSVSANQKEALPPANAKLKPHVSGSIFWNCSLSKSFSCIIISTPVEISHSTMSYQWSNANRMYTSHHSTESVHGGVATIKLQIVKLSKLTKALLAKTEQFRNS